jgi:UDP-3-O-[3-hydroxymyristoyl] glucosamine N-acyltransferase
VQSLEGHLAGNVYAGSGSFIGKGSFVEVTRTLEPNVTIQEKLQLPVKTLV